MIDVVSVNFKCFINNCYDCDNYFIGNSGGFVIVLLILCLYNFFFMFVEYYYICI